MKPGRLVALYRWVRRRLSTCDLHARLMLLAMSPVVFFAVAWGGYAIHQRGSDLDGQLRERAQLLGRQMSIAADYAVFAQNRIALESIAAGVASEASVVAAVLLDGKGQVLVRRDGAAGAAAQRWQRLEGRVRDALGHGQEVFMLDDDGVFAYVHPVRTPVLAIEDMPAAAEPSRTQGYGVVVMSVDAIRAERTRFGLIVVALLATVLLATGKLVSRFSGRIDNRLSELEEAALKIGDGSTGVRLPLRGVPAFDRLSSHINAMAQQLEQSRRQLEYRVRQATQAVRDQRDAAERANQAKTRFLAAASHDLRQPMHAISMILAVLRQQQEPAARMALHDRAEAAAQAMSDLLDALLDISRLDSGNISPHPETFSVQKMFDRLRTTYESLAERRQVTLTVRPCADLWTTSDPSMLERIVGNFVSNAIRYTAEGGQVLVAARRRAGSLLIQVRDNGPGIDLDSQRLIFEEFVQLHNPQRNRSEGLGLGLAIVQRLARLLFHPISVRSSPGRGSTFMVSVPRSAVPAPNALPAVEGEGLAADSLNGCEVLLVEDDVLVRESYRRLLELWGCSVSAHVDGIGALAYCRDHAWRPQLIVTDFRLGSAMDGVSLVDALRKLHDAPIPAAIVTGDTEDVRLQGLRETWTRVLFKPVRPVLLAQTLKALNALNATTATRK